MVKTTTTTAMTMRRTVATIAPRQDEAGRAGRTSGHGGSPLSQITLYTLTLCPFTHIPCPLPTFRVFLVGNENTYIHIHTKLIAYTNSVFFYISIDPRMKMKAQRLPSGPAHSSSLSSFPHIRGLNEWNANCTSSPSIMHPTPPPTSTWACDSLPLSVISVRLVLAIVMRERIRAV